MEHWIVDDAQDGGAWLLYNENGSDTELIRVKGTRELAQRVVDGLNAPTPEASGFVFPPMPHAVVQHEKVGPLFDRLSMQFYAAKCMRLDAGRIVMDLHSEDDDAAYRTGYNTALYDVLARSRGEKTKAERDADAATRE